MVDTRVLPLLLAGMLGACASTGPAPVDDLSLGGRTPVGAQSSPPGVPVRREYRVQGGDTLYSIAFRNGLDYRELAAWNRIGPPYTIYVGQELRLAGSTARVAEREVAARPKARMAAPPQPAPPSDPARLAAAPKPAPFGPLEPTPSPAAPRDTPGAVPAAERPAPAAAATASAAPAAVSGVPAPPPAAASVAPETAVAGEIAWRWPADGTVVGTFASGDPVRQGIDIAGKAGDPVRAAASGTVVYSGNGLIGYGELIIIKHSPAFLSAYGHNRKRLVKEGDHVATGQVIAEMGSSSASRDSLHFEIRRNGKPANPTDYLPRR